MQAEAAMDDFAVSLDDTSHNPWSGLSRENAFFENAEIGSILRRSTFYARAGVPIHFRGAAGQGKTSLALAVARRLGRPIAMMTAHEWMTADDMIGKEVGTTNASVVDKYVQSVRRSESRTTADWRQSILANAMEQGHTLVYDEFTRATAQANGILLSVLEEGVLISTDKSNDRTYLNAHPHFRIILTSNPREYAGVNDAPDALMDRMVTFDVGPFDNKTQAGIVRARTGLDATTSERIVNCVNHFRQGRDGSPENSMRGAILIARILRMRPDGSPPSDDLLSQVMADVLSGSLGRIPVDAIRAKLMDE